MVFELWHKFVLSAVCNLYKTYLFKSITNTIDNIYMIKYNLLKSTNFLIKVFKTKVNKIIFFQKVLMNYEKILV